MCCVNILVMSFMHPSMRMFVQVLGKAVYKYTLVVLEPLARKAFKTRLCCLSHLVVCAKPEHHELTSLELLLVGLV